MAKTQAGTRTGTRAKTQGTRRKTGTVAIGDDLINLIDSVSAEVKNKGLSRVSLEMDGVSLEIANKVSTLPWARRPRLRPGSSLGLRALRARNRRQPRQQPLKRLPTSTSRMFSHP